MRRGDICLVDLEPVVGSEAKDRRPAVIVSNDRANAAAERLNRGVVTVVPVTSNIARIFAFQTLLSSSDSGLSLDSKAQAEQIRSVDVERIGSAIGRVPGHVMNEVDDAIRLHLSL